MTEKDLEKLVDEMIEVLRRQRRAMAALDVEALLAGNTRSATLLAELGQAAGALEGPAPMVREKVFRVSIEAEATALLVRDALAVVRGLMGTPEQVGTYDARGALHAEGRRNVARSI